MSVSDTNADTTIAMVTTTANSRNSRPTMPAMNNSGMNTAISEMLIETMVKPISSDPFSAAVEAIHAVFDVTVNVLQHHDGVIDHEADRDGQSHQRQIVDAVAVHVHDARRCRRGRAAA